MRNIRLEVEYDGTAYSGWQTQKTRPPNRSHRKSLRTLQQVIENTLSKIIQEQITLYASGRTDAGVHACGQVCNFKTETALSLPKLQSALNSLLPKDIVITKIQDAPLNFHSRFNAIGKVYRYCILKGKYRSAFLNNRVYYYPYPIDIHRMRQGASYLRGEHDFKAFCASGSRVKDTVRKIKGIAIRTSAYDGCELGRGGFPIRSRLIVIDIHANGFLYSMVRTIVGTLLEVGRGKLPPAQVKRILLSLDRRKAGPTVPAHGLYLLKVFY
jgi:tRNA pseudouridine38-40 synthase